MPFLYETHLHTAPVSRCGRGTVRETLEYYKSAGYAGVFITNHFIDGNINCDRSLPYEEKIRFYVSDYEEGKRLEEEIGISVFFGVESSYGGTDFLIYGLDPAWFFAHPEIESMSRREMLELMREEGALIVQAHPFREARYIECIRLFPRHVHAVESYNASNLEEVNEMAHKYVEHYGLMHFAGSDNHSAGNHKDFGGMSSKTPVVDERDFVRRALAGELTPFSRKVDEQGEVTVTML